MLCTYLVYIKEKMAERGSGVSEAEMVRLLKDCVVLVTNHGSKQPSREVIHFSSAYKPEDDLVTNFPGTYGTSSLGPRLSCQEPGYEAMICVDSRFSDLISVHSISC